MTAVRLAGRLPGGCVRSDHGPSRICSQSAQNALPGAGTSRLLFQGRSRGKSAISAFLARGRRGPARPAAYVDGEHGPAGREARVAVGEQ